MKQKIAGKVRTFSKKTQGQGMTEYIIIVALIAIAALGAVTFTGGVVRRDVAAIANELAGQDGTPQETAAATNAAGAVTQASKQTNMATFAPGAVRSN